MNENFYTLTNYLHNNNFITYAMEDYLEMIYREYHLNHKITITSLSNLLNVKKSSCSKMISKLKNLNLVYTKKSISLTKSGIILGIYLFKRHLIISIFLKKLNSQNYSLNQVEKIEHFIDPLTLTNIKNLLPKI